ncbi:hypothetical protein QQ045_029998 [Rhodiola kirilowii]
MGWAVLVEKWRRGAMPGDFFSPVIRLWVQIHNIQVEYRERAVPNNLAELASRVIKDEIQDRNKDPKRRKCPRFRIEIDVGKPILHGVYLKDEGVDPVWIDYKYERLPIVCSKCGRLTHDSNSCDFEKDEPVNKKYGTKLRADYQRNMENLGGSSEEELYSGQDTAMAEEGEVQSSMNGEDETKRASCQKPGEAVCAANGYNRPGKAVLVTAEDGTAANEKVGIGNSETDKLVKVPSACTGLGVEAQGDVRLKSDELVMGRASGHIGPVVVYGDQRLRQDLCRPAKLNCRRNRLGEGSGSREGVEKAFSPLWRSGQ